MFSANTVQDAEFLASKIIRVLSALGFVVRANDDGFLARNEATKLVHALASFLEDRVQKVDRHLTSPSYCNIERVMRGRSDAGLEIPKALPVTVEDFRRATACSMCQLARERFVGQLHSPSLLDELGRIIIEFLIEHDYDTLVVQEHMDEARRELWYAFEEWACLARNCARPHGEIFSKVEAGRALLPGAEAA